MIKIITIVGARPQLIKAAAVSRVILNDYADTIEEILVHTGQHYDANMSQVFFDELDIPRPRFNLEISGGSHGSMTGRMLEAIEKVLLSQKPDWVLIYGDTNSTLAGALAASKLHIPVAHVESGLRSFNMKMPEEVNRIVSDRISHVLFCPTQAAVKNLQAEGIIDRVYNVGDVMYDVALYYRDIARHSSNIHGRLGIEPRDYALATCHRAENTDDPERLGAILSALSVASEKMPVIFPLHPRTKKIVQRYGMHDLLSDLIVVEPLSYLDMVALEQEARLILTDSGGVQKEAFFYGVPCITMRDETEWVETIQSGWNRLAPPRKATVIEAVEEALVAQPSSRSEPYGNGFAANLIVKRIFDLSRPESFPAVRQETRIV